YTSRRSISSFSASSLTPRLPTSSLFPYTTLFRSAWLKRLLLSPVFRRTAGFLSIGRRSSEFYRHFGVSEERIFLTPYAVDNEFLDRKSTRLNSSHLAISYPVCCLKKKISKTRTS